MKRVLTAVGVCALVLSLASFAVAKEKKAKPGPLTGTWECTSHGSPQGDMAFTLYLEQNKDQVTGSVSSPIGSTEITSSTFKKKLLALHIDTPQGNYVLTGKIKKDVVTDGQWSVESGQGPPMKGTWDGKKTAAAGK